MSELWQPPPEKTLLYSLCDEQRERASRRNYVLWAGGAVHYSTLFPRWRM